MYETAWVYALNDNNAWHQLTMGAWSENKEAVKRHIAAQNKKYGGKYELSLYEVTVKKAK